MAKIDAKCPCCGSLISQAFSTSAMACPKGRHPHGGTGPRHKGAYCSVD